jgi:hypothetical protein
VVAGCFSISVCSAPGECGGAERDGPGSGRRGGWRERVRCGRQCSCSSVVLLLLLLWYTVSTRGLMRVSAAAVVAPPRQAGGPASEGELTVCVWLLL